MRATETARFGSAFQGFPQKKTPTGCLMILMNIEFSYRLKLHPFLLISPKSSRVGHPALGMLWETLAFVGDVVRDVSGNCSDTFVGVMTASAILGGCDDDSENLFMLANAAGLGRAPNDIEPSVVPIVGAVNVPT